MEKDFHSIRRQYSLRLFGEEPIYEVLRNDIHFALGNLIWTVGEDDKIIHGFVVDVVSTTRNKGMQKDSNCYLVLNKVFLYPESTFPVLSEGYRTDFLFKVSLDNTCNVSYAYYIKPSERHVPHTIETLRNLSPGFLTSDEHDKSVVISHSMSSIDGCPLFDDEYLYIDLSRDVFLNGSVKMIKVPAVEEQYIHMLDFDITDNASEFWVYVKECLFDPYINKEHREARRYGLNRCRKAWEIIKNDVMNKEESKGEDLFKKCHSQLTSLEACNTIIKSLKFFLYMIRHCFSIDRICRWLEYKKQIDCLPKGETRDKNLTFFVESNICSDFLYDGKNGDVDEVDGDNEEDEKESEDEDVDSNGNLKGFIVNNNADEDDVTIDEGDLTSEEESEMEEEIEDESSGDKVILEKDESDDSGSELWDVEKEKLDTSYDDCDIKLDSIGPISIVDPIVDENSNSKKRSFEEAFPDHIFDDDLLKDDKVSFLDKEF